MAERKRGVTNRNTSELGQPTTANGNPPVANLGTKLNKNYENAIADIENLIKEKRALSAHEFLHELDNALTGLNEASTEGSDYIDIGDGFTIRVSDHYSNANTFKRFNNKEKNFGVVIKLKNRKFKSDPNVDYVELVYYPDKLDGNRQLSILDGIKGLVETKDIGGMPAPDDTHTSGKTKFSLITPEMDAAYLDAVERGDMETAQKMVMEAAKLAMPNTKVVDEDEFIQALRAFVSLFPKKVKRDYSVDKVVTEETFGGIWIEDTEEFAKFVSAVNKSPFEEDGEGIAYTDNYFYAYYRNINGEPVPYASVYMNEEVSQDIVNEILRDGREKKTAREWFDWFNAHARNVKSKNDAVVGSDKKARNTRTNGRLDSELSRYGAYYDSPEFFVKSKRTYKGSRINYSLITPGMDASYLDAVERGDMVTAQEVTHFMLPDPDPV